MLAQNAIGVYLAIDDLAIVLAKPVVTAGPPSTKSYFALSGSGSASLIGVEGVQISGRIAIEINKGKNTLTPLAVEPSIDFLESATANSDSFGSDKGLKVPTGPAADQFVIVNFRENNRCGSPATSRFRCRNSSTSAASSRSRRAARRRP